MTPEELIVELEQLLDHDRLGELRLLAARHLPKLRDRLTEEQRSRVQRIIFAMRMAEFEDED